MKRIISKVAAAIVVVVLSSATLVSCGHEEQPADKGVPVTGVSISKTSLSLVEGDSETLTSSVSPADATNKNVKWSSSNSSIATVDGSGKVTAVMAGSATITVATVDGGKTANCSVTVTAKHVPLSGIAISPAETEVTIGTPSTLTVEYTPENASNKKVTWKSSDETIAKVSSSGVVDGIKEGTATITATSEEGELKATCTVKVSAITKAGVYWTQEEIIFRDGKSLGIKTPINVSIDLDGNVYYYSDDNIYVNGVPSYQYSIGSNRDYTAAGGGYYFVLDIDNNNSEISVYKIDPKKRTSKKLSVYKGSRKNEIWVYDMTADSKGNLYLAGNITREDNVDIATLWKLDSSDKVTTTSYSDGTGAIKTGPAVDAVAVNKNGDVFCLVYEGNFGNGGYYKINLYKNGKKQFQVTELNGRSYSQKCDIAVIGSDVYMSICENIGSNIEAIKVYKNKNVIHTIKGEEEGDTVAGDIAVTSKGDVYCVGHTGAGSEAKYYIWKNGEPFYTTNKSLAPHCMSVKE